MDIEPLIWEKDFLKVLDQRLLPFEIKYEKFKIFFDNAMSNWGKLVESSEESFIEQHKSLIRNLVSQFVYSTNLHTATLYTRREELKENSLKSFLYLSGRQLRLVSKALPTACHPDSHRQIYLSSRCYLHRSTY